jgi:hypothetical protein
MSKSLRVLGKQSRAKLFLAAYYWHDDKSCVPFTRSQGYGIIQPNGRDLSAEVMALGMRTCFERICFELTVISEKQL